MMYNLLRSFLFLFDAEKVHHFSMNSLKMLCSIGFIKKIITTIYQPSQNKPVMLGKLQFKNIVGLAAGFDKNALYLTELNALGFGHVEIGTVTPLPQEGNPKVRLFRLPKDKALINRMGFNNDGVTVITERLKKWQEKNSTNKIIIGGNIGKNKITPNEAAFKDYEICFTALHPYVDYFVVNVSSPNTPGLRALQDKEPLTEILTHLQKINNGTTLPKPIFLKIAPDLTPEQVDDVIDMALQINLDGLVVSNTTINRSQLKTASTIIDNIGAGGLSGAPVKQKSTALVQYIHHKTNGRIPIIASGGVFTAADANEKIAAGASLVQVWTGFVYEGPAIVKKILQSKQQ
ncbi:quinone-dependent dihydroorotate dehydrogenase [Ferruginibacter yonginensis]|uniref:Dihydroorotate dehydrogenase (quinone) n=1 Tax=Ferruginibacter yonginensis TaxID=1310416 RepID=A0ABV8QUQ9_9BACT